MSTTTITAFGMTFATNEEELSLNFEVLDQLRIEKAAPVECIKRLSTQFNYTSAKATAMYAEWANRNKPIF